MFENLIAPKWENTKFNFSLQQQLSRVTRSFLWVLKQGVMWVLHPSLGAACKSISALLLGCKNGFLRVYLRPPRSASAMAPMQGLTKEIAIYCVLWLAGHLQKFYLKIISSLSSRTTSPIQKDETKSGWVYGDWVLGSVASLPVLLGCWCLGVSEWRSLWLWWCLALSSACHGDDADLFFLLLPPGASGLPGMASPHLSQPGRAKVPCFFP